MTTKAISDSNTTAPPRLPAEWERHEATWIGWPHHHEDWPGKFAAIPWVYGEIVRKLAPDERVRILVNDKAHETRARKVLDRVGVNYAGVEFFRFPTNRGWTRDFGPIFVRTQPHRAQARFLQPASSDSSVSIRVHPWSSSLPPNPGVSLIADFQFNAWAKYRNWKKDNAIPARAARALKKDVFQVKHNDRPVVLEGGAIDVNGCGTLITTEECLLDPNVQTRNPGFEKGDYEEVFRKTLGVAHTIWLGRGIAGDDTHGHVDDLCRFVNDHTLVLVQEPNTADENHVPLRENRERLSDARLQDGRRPDIVELPMPEPLFFEGRRLPASYANFYIANAAVLVPTFNDPKDRVALGILSELITDRPVVGIHAVDLAWGLGTLHCLTQQQPEEG